MESRSDRSKRTGLWPGLWIPLVILVGGLIVTGVAARTEAEQARQLAEARYQAEHQALVNRLLAIAPDYLEQGGPPSSWLPTLFDNGLPAGLGLRIDTLQRHTKVPLLQIGVNGQMDPTRTLRTEIQPAGQDWMVTTVPNQPLLGAAAREASATIWLVGLMISAAAAGLSLLLCRRLHRQSRSLRELQSLSAAAQQRISTLQVEKNVLRQALNESEERSRDLVSLSGAMVCELDEHGVIGFVSAQSADLLREAPSDLTGRRFVELIRPEFRDNFEKTLVASRQERQSERIDLILIHRHDERGLPATIRIKALTDPLHGLTGYRLSATPGTPERD